MIMAGLIVDPTIYSDLTFPSIKKPIIDGYFSIDENRRYVNDLRNLKYLKLPDKKDLPLDLNSKLDNYYEKSEATRNEKLEHMLQYILINLDRLINKENCLNCDVVAFRGLLRMICSAPYESSEDFIILATKYKNTIYLCAEETERSKSERLNRTPNNVKFCKYGFIFEHFLLNDGPKKSSHKKEDIIESEEFCCVFSTKLEQHSLLYGAEMDGVKSSKIIRNLEDLRKAEFVELKVKRKENNEKQVNNFYRFKTKKWWAQSFLVGIDNICVGLRDDDGMVKEVVNMPLRDIVHKSKQHWSASICLRFLNDFLTKVKKDMTGIDCPLTVFKYTYDPLKDKKINLSKFIGENIHSFLPKHYIQFLDEVD